MDEDEDKELTAEQTDILINFQNLSGLDDLNHCRQILERSGWDPNIAVQHIFGEPEPAVEDTQERGMGEGSLHEPVSPRSPASATPRVAISPSTHRSYEGGPAPIERWGWMEWVRAGAVFPFRFVFNSIYEILKFVWSFFASGNPRFAPSTPVQDVQKFIEDFEHKYGVQHPVFYRGGYKEAYSDAKKELRFLLLYLHQDSDSDSDRFCADALTNPEVVALINSKTLFWACSTQLSEGYKVAQALQATRFPSLGLIACKSGQMTLVGRLHGYHAPRELIDRLNQLFSANDRHLNAARMERRQLDMNQTLRREQDEAYQKSLKADQDKARSKLEEKMRKEMEERHQREEAERQEREEKMRGENLAYRKQEAFKKMPREPEENATDMCRVSIKLPDGKNLKRRFLKSDTVADLYNYIFSQPDAPEHFEVFTSYPRKSIDCKPDTNKVIATLDPGNAIALIVEEKELESDSESDLRTTTPR
ncbi:FAS-associated factor 2-like [Paramacrobiotus metropolitanus]|uniref:FAS-associated factor 2-like n=1 Tax=Paramacrobiotus metropolitanus TaxID=2943436 RepID=UPI0024460D50|nr:FAS-associated factor 2-like [Paramacrobiotus metropolitanus]